MEGKKCTDEYTEYQEHMGYGDRKQEGWESTHTPGRTVRRVRKGWPLLFAVTHMRHGTGTALSLQECVGKVETQNWTLWNCHSSIFYLKTLQFSVPQSNTFNSKSTSVLTYSQHLFLINLTHSVGILTSTHKRPPIHQHPLPACQLPFGHCARHRSCKTKDHPASLQNVQSNLLAF